MSIYVVGFAFDHPGEHGLFVEKTHPSWQRGRMNGLGGKVDSGERPNDAMARKFREETRGTLVGSAAYRPDGWRHVASLVGDDWQSLVYTTRLNFMDISALNGTFNDEHERLVALALGELPYRRTLPNVLYLVPLCVYERTVQTPVIIAERHHGAFIDEAKGGTVWERRMIT